MLEFVQGDARNPTGNLLVFSEAIGYNPVQPGGRYIVCNVVVSFVSASTNHFPVVIFPPTALNNEEELQAIMQLQNYYDVVRLEDFEVPAHRDENDYVKERLEDFNRCVMEYVELCRHSLEDRLPVVMEPVTDSSVDKAQAQEDLPDDEATTLDRLEDLIVHEQADRTEIRELIKHIEVRFPRYDIRNLERALARDSSAGQLPRLYIQKFRAIMDEKYEEAATLQSRIRQLERSI